MANIAIAPPDMSMTRVHREVSVCKVVPVPEVQCCCCAVTNNYNNYEVTAALKCIEYADTGHHQSQAAAAAV